MSQVSNTVSGKSHLADELACYSQAAAMDVALTGMDDIVEQYGARYRACQDQYQLPAGKLRQLLLTVYVPVNTSTTDIESIRLTAIKTALAGYQSLFSQGRDIQTKQTDIMTRDVLVFDIQLVDSAAVLNQEHVASQYPKQPNRLPHAFGARYFLEELVVDMSEGGQQLQVFSWHDWHSMLAAVQTPCELWRFLGYHLAQLQSTATSQSPSFLSEKELVTQFLQNSAFFTPAIAVDNTLIKYDMQDKPNPALIAMALAYKNQSATAQMYQHHMQQAAVLWSQLSTQMIAAYEQVQVATGDQKPSEIPVSRWMQQLLDESLFSRHELIRTLYNHPKQQQALRQDGYVVHQHSYESLGRHYVLIFYGQDSQANNSKATIQPNLAKIAQDVASRLPIAELHHIVVLGIDFITEANDTFIDIDVWIQPVDTMTQRERQLTKQIQQLKKQNSQKSAQNTNKQIDQNFESNDRSKHDNQPDTLPQIHLNLSIPARNNT